MPLWSLFLLQAMLPPNPPAVTAPPPCPTPPQYTYSDWELTREERQFQGEWVVQYLRYSRTKTDECRGTSVGQSKVEGPYRLWPAVPAKRVADVNRSEGPTDSLSGSPLRSSTIPEGGAPGTVGPNPEQPKSQTSGVPGNKLPVPLPFFPGFALFAGVLVASFLLRRRTSKQDPVPEHTEELVQGPPPSPDTARTMDSIKPNTEWVPDSAEVVWLQAFYGIDEQGYGPLTQDAVKRLQEKYNIPVDGKRMIGPNTYRALWQEHLNLVHDRWQALAEGHEPADLDRVLDSPMPPDLREEIEKLNDTYKGYWAAVEGQYQAILRRDPTMVAAYGEQMSEFQGAGLKVGEIPVLKDKYQPLIDALYDQAEKVKNDPDDGEYAKLLAMIEAADKGEWGDIPAEKATWGDRWTALWRNDANERKTATDVLSVLAPYASGIGGAVSGARIGSRVSLVEANQTSEEENAGSNGDQQSVSTDEWSIPRRPYNIENPVSDQEKWLAVQVRRLNSEKVHEAAEFFVKNAADHGLKYDVAQVARDLSWDQDKINKTWQYGLEKGVDPRFLLAIILHEGTGSFNTNRKVTTARGTPGPDPDFDQDLRKALDGHVGQKLRAYGQYGEAFREAVLASGIPGDGGLFQYINYPTPADAPEGYIWVGGYATDVDWWSNGGDGGVFGYFRALTNPNGPAQFEAYLRKHPPVMNTPSEKRPEYEFHASWAGATASDECVLAPHRFVKAYLKGTYNAQKEPNGPYLPDPSTCN